jgi:hypothetical protein
MIKVSRTNEKQLTFLFTISASALIQRIATHMHSQLNNNLPKTITFPAGLPYFSNSTTETWDMNITDVEIGSVVIALTWAAVGLMVLNLGVWALVLVSGVKEDRKVGNVEGQKTEMSNGREV